MRKSTLIGIVFAGLASLPLSLPQKIQQDSVVCAQEEIPHDVPEEFSLDLLTITSTPEKGTEVNEELVFVLQKIANYVFTSDKTDLYVELGRHSLGGYVSFTHNGKDYEIEFDDSYEIDGVDDTDITKENMRFFDNIVIKERAYKDDGSGDYYYLITFDYGLNGVCDLGGKGEVFYVIGELQSRHKNWKILDREYEDQHPQTEIRTEFQTDYERLINEVLNFYEEQK